MNDLPEYLANIRYMTNQMVLQIDNVHRLCCNNELDVETVQLNVSDLRDQMTTILAELNDMYERLGETLTEDQDAEL